MVKKFFMVYLKFKFDWHLVFYLATLPLSKQLEFYEVPKE